VHVEPGVVAVGDHGFSGMKAHADLDRGAVRPRKRRQRALPGYRGGSGSLRAREHDEEGVALGVDLDTALGRECGTKKAPVLVPQQRLTIADLLRQPCRSLDLGEQEGERAAGEILASGPHASTGAIASGGEATRP
jgi:hypothetical protein